MSFKLLGGGSDLNTIVSDVNQNVLELKGREVTEVFKDDTGARRVLLGKGPDGFYGLKVSQPTFDVFTAGDDDLVFNSSQNVFKITTTGTTTITVPNPPVDATSYTSTVNHNLGYIPAVSAFALRPGGVFRDSIPLNIHSFDAGTGFYLTELFLQLTVTDTSLVFTLRTLATRTQYAGSWEIRYYLLQETAN